MPRIAAHHFVEHNLFKDVDEKQSSAEKELASQQNLYGILYCDLFVLLLKAHVYLVKALLLQQLFQGGDCLSVEWLQLVNLHVSRKV